jgi:hypothetical protein
MTTAPPTLDGTLDDLPLASLLRLLATRERSGDLHLTASTPAMVRMNKGAVDFASTNDISALRRALRPVAPNEDWARVTGRATTPEQAITLAMSEWGAEKVAVEGLREQTLMTIFEFAVPTSGTFAFYEHDDDAPHSVHPGFSVESLLEAVDEQVEAWREIAKTVPSTEAVFEMAPTLPEGIGEVHLGESDWKLLACIDGHRDVAAIIEKLEADPYEVCGGIHHLCTNALVQRGGDQS